MSDAIDTMATRVPEQRFGMLTPSSNTVLEPATQALLAPLADRVTAHFARFRVTEITTGPASDRQFDAEPRLAAAALLRDAKPTVIAWNGTAAAWMGFSDDEDLCAEIEARTGAPATTTIVSLNALLRERGCARLGLVTPYTDDVQRRIVANYADIGIAVVAERHFGISDNYGFADFPDRTVAQACRDVAAARPDAIAIVCTNMRGALITPALEHALGLPVFDSVAVTLWGCLRLAGVDARPLAAFGSLFAEPAPA